MGTFVTLSLGWDCLHSLQRTYEPGQHGQYAKLFNVDFTNAFDRIKASIPIFFASFFFFLIGEHQTVTGGNESFSYRTSMLRGVPQGTNCVPIMSMIYTIGYDNAL